MRRNAWKDIANMQTKRLNICTKVATRCFDDHQFKEEEIRICLRTVKSMRSNCSEMLVFRSNWWTLYFVVSEQTCPCHREVDESMREAFSTFDFLHS